MKVHPAALAFPEMSAEEFAALRADIDENGLRVPIIRHRGMILDGRARYCACVGLGIRPVFKIYRGKDPVGFVRSMNDTRRHLTDAQIVDVLAKLAALKEAERA